MTDNHAENAIRLLDIVYDLYGNDKRYPYETLPFSVNVVSCRKLEDVLTRLSGSKLYGYIDREVHRGAKRPGNKGGQVVSVLAFCSDDPSLNLAVNFFGNNDNKRNCCEYLRVAYNPSF